MDQREKIDILMATYNGEKYVKEQVLSILNQTYTNFRLIISDDNSEDNTLNILEELKEKDKRIEIYTHDKNLGVSKNFEFLLRKVISKYYMFADQDDVWYDDKIEKTYVKMICDSYGLVCTDLNLVDENLNSLGDTFNHHMKKLYKLRRYDDYRMVMLYNVVTGCTIMSKKEYIRYVLPFPENKNILHDHWIPLVISQRAKIGYLNEPTMNYRQHGNNQVGTKKYTDRFSNFEEVRDYLIDLKISIFTTYLDRKYCFTDEFNKISEEALNYFKYVKNVKYINFKYLGTFYKLYKYDTKFYFLWNYILMNVPCIASLGYRIKNYFKNKR